LHRKKSEMKKILFLLILLLSFYGHSQRIEGFIFEAKSGQSLPGINIYLTNLKTGCISNANGFYHLDNLSKGEYQVVVSGTGFQKIEKVVSISGDETLTLNFELNESTFDIPEVVIKGISLTGGIAGLNEIPGSAHYISPKEIEKFTYTDINRTLRAVPGINLQEEDGFGLRPNIGIRGTGLERSSKITVMEDGVLMAPAPYAAPAAYYFPTIGTMEAVEILKGSSQIKYGPYTTGGAINLISTKIPNGFAGKVQLSGGSFNNRNLHAFVGDNIGQFSYLVETFQYSSDGFKELENNESTGFNKEDYRIKLKFNSKKDAKMFQSLQLKLGRSDEISNETYLGLTDADFLQNPFLRYASSQEDVMNTQQSQFSLSHLIELTKDVSIYTTVYRTEFARNWYKLDAVIDSSGTKTKISAALDDTNSLAFSLVNGTASADQGILLVKANNRSYYSQGIQSIVKYNLEGEKLNHGLEFGIRVHEDQIDRFQWIDDYVLDNGEMELINSGVPGTESNRIETANAVAAYFQYKIELGSWTLNPGVRYENVSIVRNDFGTQDPERIGADISSRENSIDAFIPGIGFTYDWNEYVNLFGGVHKGFAPPGSSPLTDPESSVNYELGLRTNKKQWNGQAVLFFNDYENLLGSDLAAAGGSGTTALYNGGEAQTYGLEFQSTWQLVANDLSKFNVPFSLIYTFTEAEFLNSFDSDFSGWGAVEAGDNLPYVAQNQLTILCSIEHKKYNLNFNARYIDEMRTRPGQGDILKEESTDNVFTIDIGANYFLNEKSNLFMNLNNLSNRVYNVSRRPAGLRPGLPRSFNIGVRVRI